MYFRNLMIVLCLLASAAQAQAPEPAASPAQTDAAQGPAQSPAQLRMQPPPSLTPGSDYLILPGDVIEVQYRYTPEFNQIVTVQPDGYITLPIAGSIKVAELTLEQVRMLILKRAGERLREPEAIVTLKEFQKPYFVVAGEVVQPGRMEMRERITALQAVMLAGGFKDSARSSQILIFRRLNSDEAEVKSVDLRNIKTTNDLQNDLMLRPGDMLLVPQNRITKVSRFIKLINLGLFFNPLDVIRR
jgi:polysaccharide biosynthesis/export protein